MKFSLKFIGHEITEESNFKIGFVQTGIQTRKQTKEHGLQSEHTLVLNYTLYRKCVNKILSTYHVGSIAHSATITMSSNLKR